ncbi:hypothetical protein G7068_03400 [Leucobacter viscericola]|uniref:Uncharacterized protein n=1 Tax=Leucobacter viscericola TaxID=2714935 RepID=A0A6G7XDB2_9MICO|nr:hypothetical protein [Leucobacter viscericola]QIK62361.1 hypothetical protein G7068_03400 [Leucobacter viscericola]
MNYGVAARAVERLTQVHEVSLGDRQAVADPLLSMLWDARYASIGAGGTRGGGDGSMLNYKAFDLYEEIDGYVRAQLNEYRQPHTGDLLQLVPKMLATVQAELAGNRIEEDYAERLLAKFDQWVWKIEDLFDPPHEKEITVNCPDCGERYHATTTYERRGNEDVPITTVQAAIRIPVKAGRALVAECHCCGRMWATQSDLIELAQAVGHEVDFVALHAAT